MKVLIGVFERDQGTVETTPEGLVFGGPDPERTHNLVENKREWYDAAGDEHRLTDDVLVRSLPYRLHGWLWAVFVDGNTGETLDQPPYDPWGKIWLSSPWSN